MFGVIVTVLPVTSDMALARTWSGKISPAMTLAERSDELQFYEDIHRPGRTTLPTQTLAEQLIF